MKEISSSTSATAQRQTCQHIVRKLITKYGWALLSEDELVALVLKTIWTEAAPSEIEKLVRHHYTATLYNACLQNDDNNRRERGYYELFLYLYRAAYNRWPDLAEDVTQRAILLVYEQIDNCREPGAFLSFAFFKLLQAAKDERQARGKELPSELSQDSQVAFHSSLNQKERLQILVEAISHLSNKRQRKTILLKFFGGLSDEEISKRLRITVNNVRVQRYRGLQQLRQNKLLNTYFEKESSSKEKSDLL